MRLLGLVVFLAPAIASADAPLALTVAGRGSSLELTFKNTSSVPVTFTTHVKAGLDHHDDLTVTVTGTKVTRTMTFSERRTKAIPIDETLKPGATLTRSVDLVLWSIHGENAGGPLAAGAYDIAVVWDSKKPKQKLTATTKLVIPDAKETGCKEKPGTPAKLALLAQQEKGTAKAAIGLHNTDTVSHCVYGIIRTHEVQNDWLTLAFEHAGATHAIGLSGDRDKSAPVAYELPPGATVWTTWDLAAWHKRASKLKLPANAVVWITATWNASREREVWRGTATTGFGMRWP